MARNFFDSLRTVFSLWTKHSFLPFFALSGFIFHLLLYHPPLENCGFPVLKPFCSHFGNNDSENEFVKSLMNYSGFIFPKSITYYHKFSVCNRFLEHFLNIFTNCEIFNDSLSCILNHACFIHQPSFSYPDLRETDV